MGRKRTDGFLTNPTFNQWLFHRRESYPKLARWIAHDRGCWPERPRTLQTVLDHLREHADHDEGTPSETMLRAAFTSYVRDREAKVRIPRRLAKEPLPDSERRLIKTYSLAPTTPATIQRLARKLGLESGGRVIDFLAERALAER